MSPNFFGIILMLGGMAMIVRWVYLMYRAIHSKNWPSNFGTITSSEIVRVGRSSWLPKITYKYSANEEEFEGKRIRLSSSSCSMQCLAQKVLDNYPLNSPVSVFYNPNNPKDSVLSPGVTMRILELLLGGVMMIAGGYFLFTSNPTQWIKCHGVWISR